MALPQKIYKLRQTKLSQFVYFSLVLREQEETKTKYSTPKGSGKDLGGTCPTCPLPMGLPTDSCPHWP